MYSAAVYNYFNNGKRKKPKCRKKKIPIPKPTRTRKMNICKSCGRAFLKIQHKHETDTQIEQPTGNIVYEKFLLIWKYAKSLLSSTVHENDHQKCSFKIISHKSYKKRSLHQEIVSVCSSTSSKLYSTICENCKIQKIKRKNTKENSKRKKHIHKQRKYNNKKNDKRTKKIHWKKCYTRDNTHYNEINDDKLPRTELLPNNYDCNINSDKIHTSECLGGRKRHIKLCTESSRSSFNKKKQKCNCKNNLSKVTKFEKLATKKKQNKKKSYLPKRKFNIKKKKRLFLMKNRKKINRFSSWQYMQHALNSVGEDNIINYVNEDTTPVYLTFDEYCIILEAIDIPGNTIDKFRGAGDELSVNIEEISCTETLTKQSIVKTEDASTNTDVLNENTEDASTNTEYFDYTNEIVTYKRPISEITRKLNSSTEQTNEITDVNSEQFSETTETLDAINDPPSEAIEEFCTNTEQLSDSATYFETIPKESNKNIQGMTTSIEIIDKKSSTQFYQNRIQLNTTDEKLITHEKSLESINSNVNNKITKKRKGNKNVVPNNSLVDINKMDESEKTVDLNLVSKKIQKIEKSYRKKHSQKNIESKETVGTTSEEFKGTNESNDENTDKQTGSKRA